MIEIKNKWALVTGASRGIGRLAALQLAKHGCHLILHSRVIGHCETLLEEVHRMGVEAYEIAADLSDTGEVIQMLAEINRRQTPVDIVLNNAGLQVAYREHFLKTPVSDYEISFQVNTISPMMICYHFLPQMQQRGFGRIINTTSGIDLDPQQAGYSASKAALDKVTRDLGLKYEGTDVILSLTDPGWCRTELGGSNAPNAPESALPGVLVGVFVNDGKSGRCFPAQAFKGMTLEEAVRQAEEMPGVYPGR